MSRETTARHGQPAKDRRLIALAAAAVLAVGTYVVLAPFIVSIAWAIILVLVTWPVYRLLRSTMKHRPGLAAALMTVALAIVIMVPVGFLVFAAVAELQGFVDQIAKLFKADSPQVPGWVKSMPLIGAGVEDWVKKYDTDYKADVGKWFTEHAPGTLRIAQGVVGGVVEVLFKISMCLFTAFFLYRHGETLAAQLGRVARQVGGRYENLLKTIRGTVRAAVYGVLLTALAQGFLAGIGFFITGAPVPLLLSLATVVASLIPFAPPVIYLGAAGAMLAQNPQEWWWAAGLALWGIAIVSTADNVIRPLFISQATHTPLLLVFFGVIGGIVAFGLIGVILGPVILTVAMVLWKEWAQVEDTSDVAADTGHS